jgi:hypothetical protein
VSTALLLVGVVVLSITSVALRRRAGGHPSPLSLMLSVAALGLALLAVWRSTQDTRRTPRVVGEATGSPVPTRGLSPLDVGPHVRADAGSFPGARGRSPGTA